MTQELFATISMLVAIATVLLSMWLNNVWARRHWRILNARQSAAFSGTRTDADVTQCKVDITKLRARARRGLCIGFAVVLSTMLLNGMTQWQLFVHHVRSTSVTWVDVWTMVLISIAPLLLMVQSILLVWMVVMWLWLGNYLRTPLSLVDPSV